MIAFAVWLTLLVAAWPATAQTMFPANESMVRRTNAGAVGIVSGGVDGTYIQIAADLAAVLDDGDRLRVLAMIGKGSVGNISDIMFLRGIDIGIVQSDALAYVQHRKLYPGVDQAIQYITKLYDEELHILARKDITRLQDLTGQTVNVDVPSSGTAMTVSVVLELPGDRDKAGQRRPGHRARQAEERRDRRSRLCSRQTNPPVRRCWGRQRVALSTGAVDAGVTRNIPAVEPWPFGLSRSGVRGRRRRDDRDWLGHGGICLAGKFRPLPQGSAIYRGFLRKVSIVSEGVAASEVEGGQPSRTDPGLDTLPRGPGVAARSDCRRCRRRRAAQ